MIVKLINQGSYFGTFFLHTIHDRCPISGDLEEPLTN